jgi:hypothetical protein
MRATVGVGNAAPVSDMIPPPRRPQIIIRMAPRLLADTLCLALRSEGLDVEQRYPDELTVETVGQLCRFDLAVVTDELPGDVIAETILVLDPSGTTLSVVRKEQHRSIAFEGDLTHLIGMIERLLKDPVVGT